MGKQNLFSGWMGDYRGIQRIQQASISELYEYTAYSTGQYTTERYCTGQYSTGQYTTERYCTGLYLNVSFRAALNFTVLDSTLYRTTLLSICFVPYLYSKGQYLVNCNVLYWTVSALYWTVLICPVLDSSKLYCAGQFLYCSYNPGWAVSYIYQYMHCTALDTTANTKLYCMYWTDLTVVECISVLNCSADRVCTVMY